MAPKKHKTSKKSSKKRRKSAKRSRSERIPRTPKSIDAFESRSNLDTLASDGCAFNQYDDNISLYEKENMDLLDTIEGVKYDQDEFKRSYPHLAEEMGDQDLTHPVDAVRWGDEDCSIEAREEPTESSIESLLRRSKTEEEGIEIILYLEKQGEITSRDASKLISKMEKKGLKAFKRKKK